MLFGLHLCILLGSNEGEGDIEVIFAIDLYFHSFTPMNRYCYLVYCIVFLFVSCDMDVPKANFAVLGYSSSEHIFFKPIDSLQNGMVDLANGLPTKGELFFAEKDGKYYGIDENTGQFSKYGYENNRFKFYGSIPFEEFTGWTAVASWYSWVSDHEMLIGSSRRGKQFMYVLVDVKSMRVLKHGNLDIPLPPKGINYGGVMGRLVDNKLYIAYMLYNYEDKAAPAGDTIYLATIDYPEMHTRKITTDARSTFPGGYNLFWQVSAVYEGYLYFITQPGGRLRFHPTYKPAVMRIKVGTDFIDPDYFFPLDNERKDEFYGLYDIGGGMALTKAVDLNKIKEFSDYFAANTAGYYLLDLKNRSTQKVDFPTGKLDFYPNFYRNGDQVFAAINDSSGNASIYSYGLKTGQIQKGLRIKGDVIMLNKLP